MAIVSGSQRHNEVVSLGMIIVRDMLKHAFFLILLLSIILVSFFIIKQVQITRGNVATLNKEYKYQDQLDQKYQHLRLQQSALTEHYRVTDIANKQLQMKVPPANEEVIINLQDHIRK